MKFFEKRGIAFAALVLAIAAAALAMALIDFMRKDPAPQARPTQEETEDGI